MNPYKEQQVERLHNNILFRMRVLGYDLDRKEKCIRINPNRSVRNGVDHQVPEVPDELFAKCPGCKQAIYHEPPQCVLAWY